VEGSITAALLQRRLQLRRINASIWQWDTWDANELRPTDVGKHKTRAMASWCEERGFKTRVVERPFGTNFQVEADEPRVALCGVDNPQARAALEEVGFARVVEAGLGAGAQEYLSFQMHTFPTGRSARERWGGQTARGPRDVEDLLKQPAYRRMAQRGMDECGLVTLAGRSVGAPFVGTAVSALVVAEVLRLAIGEQRYDVIDGSLHSLGRRIAVGHQGDSVPFNPSTTPARP
jgi:hypothetical protein